MSQYPHSAEPAPQPQPQPQSQPLVTVGRYLLHRQIARGGMATIHIARLLGDEGFSRIVAAKRLLPEFAEDPEFVAMFLDEARIASRIHHRNVVPVLDVVATGDEVILVQEYVHGAPLYWLLRAAQRSRTRIPLEVAVSIACQVLAGLHAAHETLDEMGAPLHVVHRDVSPQNVMIAVDGTARLLDFGIAKATMTAHVTRQGQFKGKLAYAAPEQLYGHAARQSDLYSLSALLWEILVGRGMHHGVQGDVELIAAIMNGRLQSLTDALAADRDAIGPDRWRQLQALEPVLRIGLSLEAADRWPTAADMEQALTDVVRPASPGEVAAWLRSLGREFIDKHERALAAEEASWRRLGTTASTRLTPIPRELAPEPSAPVHAPPPATGRWRIRSSTWIAALCGVAVAVAIVLVVGASPAGSAIVPAAAVPRVIMPAAGAPPPATLLTEPAPTPASPVPAEAMPPLPSVVAPTTAAAIQPTGPTAAATTQPAAPTAAVATQPTAPTAAAETQPAAPGSVDAPTRAAAKPVRPVRPPAVIRRPPPPGPDAATPARPAAAPAADCNPPYYFDGAKKIFKPACL